MSSNQNSESPRAAGEGRSFADKAGDRLRRLLGLQENLAADAGEAYHAPAEEEAPSDGAPTPAEDLGADAASPAPAGDAALAAGDSPLLSTEGMGAAAPLSAGGSAGPEGGAQLAAEVEAAAAAFGAGSLASGARFDALSGGGVSGAGTAAGDGGGGGGASSKEPPLEGGGADQGVVVEDSKFEVSGLLKAQGGVQAHYQPETLSGRYGDLTVEADGHWRYVLRPGASNDPSSVQGLNNGDVYRETFTTRLTDATGRQIQVPVVVTVQGTDDAAVISGARTGSLTEDLGPQRSTGQLIATDIDRGDLPTFVVQSVQGKYGAFDLQPDGHWSYVADPQKIQGLKDGQQVVDSFPVATTNAAGESAQATVAIAIVGTDDKALFPPVSLTAKEDGGMVVGHLVATDADAQRLSYGLAPGALAVPGVGVDPDGTVHVDPSRPEYQNLAAGEHRDLQIPVVVTDERGVSVSSTLTVRIDGTNDAPTVTVHPPVPADEGSGVHSTQVLATDVDSSDKLSYGIPAGATLPPGVTLDGATGQVSIDTSHGAYNHLAAGEVQQVVVPVVVSDGHGGSTSTQVSFEVRGTNDAPVLAAIGQRTATEGGAAISGQLSGSDPDSSDQLSYGLAAGMTAPAGLTIQPDGQWSFDPTNPAYEHLRAGEQQQVVVPLEVRDGHGGVSQQSLSITVVGTNDGAVIGGTTTGTATEDIQTLVTGQLTVADQDLGEDRFLPGDHQGTYGSLHLSADGGWSYALNNNDPKVQALAAGQTITDTMHVRSADGTDQAITITIQGRDDAAVITGVSSGLVREDVTMSTSGQLQVTDVDSGETPTFHAETLQGVYGQLVIDSSGHWNYQLDPAASQVLQGGVTARETFTVLASDGKGHQVNQVVLVDVQGSADAARISGSATGTVTEDLQLAASGKLDVVDPDRNEAHFQAGDQAGAYGTLHLEADGSWTYQLNNASPQVQQLMGSDQVSERFTVASVDGTTHQINIQVLGRNDVAQISGTTSGQVTEDGLQQATGQLAVSDLDRTESHFQAGDQTGIYGSLHLDADGQWRYTLNNAASGVQALGARSSGTDTFTVRSADGTTQTLTVRVGGTNDAAVITGSSTGSVKEDATLTASGQLQISDVDNGEAGLLPGDIRAFTGQYGTLTMQADGHWTYQLNNSARIVQDLQAGDARTDSFTVHSIDGTDHHIDLTIAGASDAPVLSAGQMTGAKEDVQFTLTEAQVLAAVKAHDPDNDPLHIANLSLSGTDATLTDNHNGTWTLIPKANWSGDLQLNIGVSDGHDVTTGTLTIPVAAVADQVTLTVAPSLSSNFEDPTLGSQGYHFTDPTQWGWNTDNLSGKVEQGKGETYGDPNHANTGLIELEGYAGERDNLYRILDTQPGAMYHFSLDVSGRVGTTSPDDAAVEVLWEGKVIETIRPAVNAFGMVRHDYDLTAHTEHPRIEFRALDHSGGGPLVDNPNFQFRGFRGTEDTPLPIKLTVETPDKDGSESVGAAIKGLPAGFVLTDGTTGHRLTSTGVTQTIDMQGWDLQRIQVIPTANFHGNVDAVLIATSTESANHDQSSTQIPVPLVFDPVNDWPTVQITASSALSEGSTSISTSQVTGNDPDGDTTSIDTVWLGAHGWSTADGGATYTKVGTYGTATLTTASGSMSYQLNNAAGSLTDQLADGQNVRDTFEVQISDGHSPTPGTAIGTAVFNVTGTNDAPTVTAGKVSPLAEGSARTATVLLSMRDPDSTDPSPTVDTAWLASHGWTTADGGATYTKAGTYGNATLTVMSNTVSYLLNNTAGGAADLLRAGVSAQEPFQVQVVDSHGATATTQVSFDITGTNDAPVLQAQTQSATEDGHVLTGQMVATDVDTGDTMTFSLATPVAGLTLNPNGSFSFDPGHADYQHLTAGETQSLKVPVTVTDSAGATSSQLLVITLTGTNDGPVLKAQSQAVTEDASVLTGRMVATDSDRGDTLIFSAGKSYAGLTFNNDGSYTFDPSHADYQSLKAGEVRTLTVPVTVTDGSGATSQQNLVLTVTGTDDAPAVTATSTNPAVMSSATEDTDKTYSSADLLRLVGATDIDSTTLTVSDVHVDASVGSFRASGDNWIFTPASNYSTAPGATIPVMLTIRDEQGQTTTAYAQTSVASVTDKASATITVGVEHDVMDFGKKAGHENNSHVYSSVSGGELTHATFEIVSIGDAANKGDRTSGTGPVLLNLATSNTNNLVSFWRPANLSIAFNAVDYATDQHLAPGASGGIDMTTGTHRVTTTWDAATGELRVYDNGDLHNIFTGVMKSGKLDVTSNGILTLGQKMNNYGSRDGFQQGEQYSGTIFSASFGTTALSEAQIKSGPMANLPTSATGLQANFQWSGTSASNSVPGQTATTSGFTVSNVSSHKEWIDVTAMPPQVGASLKLTLGATAPSDTDDVITHQMIRGLPPGTVISDGGTHTLTVDSTGQVDLTHDTRGWSDPNNLMVQLPPGHNTNFALQLIVETTGPDGVVSQETVDSSVPFLKTTSAAALPAPPPPAPDSPVTSSDSPDATVDSDGQIAQLEHQTDHTDPVPDVAVAANQPGPSDVDQDSPIITAQVISEQSQPVGVHVDPSNGDLGVDTTPVHDAGSAADLMAGLPSGDSSRTDDQSVQSALGLPLAPVPDGEAIHQVVMDLSQQTPDSDGASTGVDAAPLAQQDVEPPTPPDASVLQSALQNLMDGSDQTPNADPSVATPDQLPVSTEPVNEQPASTDGQLGQIEIQESAIPADTDNSQDQSTDHLANL